MCEKSVFHLFGEHILAARLDHVLPPVHKGKKAVLILPDHVPGVEPAVFEGGSCLVFPPVVARHDTGTFQEKLSRLSLPHGVPLPIHDSIVQDRADDPDGTILVEQPGRGKDRYGPTAGLGKTVRIEDVRFRHVLPHTFLQVPREGRRRGRKGPDVGDVVGNRFRNGHDPAEQEGGNDECDRDPFLVDVPHVLDRVEPVLEHHLGAGRHERVQAVVDDHMEQGEHLKAHVLLGQIHVTDGRVDGPQGVGMGHHGELADPRRTSRAEEDVEVVRRDVHLRFMGSSVAQECLVVGRVALRFPSHLDEGSDLCEVGHNLIHHGDEFLMEQQNTSVGQVDQVPNILGKQPRLHWKEDHADLGQGVVRLHHGRDVLGDHRHLVPLPEPHRKEGVRQAVHPLIELGPGVSDVLVDQGLPVREAHCIPRDDVPDRHLIPLVRLAPQGFRGRGSGVPTSDLPTRDSKTTRAAGHPTWVSDISRGYTRLLTRSRERARQRLDKPLLLGIRY